MRLSRSPLATLIARVLVGASVATFATAAIAARDSSAQTAADLRVIAVVERSGDAKRLAETYEVLRPIVDAVVQEHNPGARTALAPGLDALFSPETLSTDILTGFFVALDADVIEAVEAWANDARMREINAAIRDFAPTQPAAAGDAVPSDRLDLLSRILVAMALPDNVRSRMASQWEIAAHATDAINPGASAAHQLRGMRAPPIPDDRMLVQAWLVPALANVPDGDLQRFLRFAESPAGHSYFSAYVTSCCGGNGQWRDDMVALLGKTARTTVAAPADASVGPLLDKARHLLHAVSTTRVMPEARALLLQAEAIEPDNAEIQSLLGEAATAMRAGPRPSRDELRVPTSRANFADAEAYFEKSIALDPTRADPYVRLGHVKFLQGMDEEAQQLYDKAYALDPDHPWIVVNLADLAQIRGDANKAIALYLQALAKPEGTAHVHYFALLRSRPAFLAASRANEFTQAARGYLEKNPDADLPRIVLAEHLLSQQADGKDVIAVLDPAFGGRDHATKRSPMARALMWNASRTMVRDGTLTAEGRDTVLKAVASEGSASAFAQRLCYSDAPVAHAALVVQVSETPADTATLVLGCALVRNDLDAARAMLVAGADVNGRSEQLQDTMLAATVYQSNAEAFSLLLEHGADTTRPFRDGNTARDVLARGGDAKRKDMLAMLDAHEARAATAGAR